MKHPLATVWARTTSLALVLMLAFGPVGTVYAAEATTTTSLGSAATASTTPATEKTDTIVVSSTPLNELVVTGGAAAQTDSENDLNSLTLSTASSSLDQSEASTSSAEAPGQIASTTSSTLASSTEALAQSTTTLAVQNVASTTASTTAVATTGDNTAHNREGDAAIATGDAYAAANAINVINTNIVDSNGLLYFKNLFSALGINLGTLDLSYFTSSPTASCANDACGGFSVTTSNTASTTNSVDVVATTGGNTASSTGNGTATITTGNAYASGNAVNIINSNFVRSNYLLVALNDFGNLPGDIVLPDAPFFQTLLTQSVHDTAGLSLTTNNKGSVANSTAAVANSGDNTASSTGSGSSLVSTGAALSSATNLDQVNTNLVGGTSVFMLFRIWGNWNGTVRGLPAGLTWRETGSGVEITNAEGNSVSGAALAPGGRLAVNATNTAALANQVNVYALTGDNHAQTADGTSTVATGNAYASANSVNIVNTNLVGHNWIYAIFNIFGNVTGDIAFGQPNLWVGVAAQASNSTLPGAKVPFTFTIANRGNALATNVLLSVDFLSQMLQFTTGSSTATTTEWNLGSLEPGQTKEVTMDALTGGVPLGGSVAVPVTATVSSDGSDADPSDNTDQLALIVSNPSSGSDGPSFSSDPVITVTPQVGAFATTVPAVLSYAALVANTGGNAYNAVATDVIRDAKGALVSEQSWDLGTLAFNDELKISYEAAFASSTEPGKYTNVMTVSGRMHYPDGSSSVAFTPVSATTTITLLPQPQSAPEASAPVAPCGPYLTTYLSPGGANDPTQVRKLQSFLSAQGLSDGVSVNGIFDAATVAAVKQFQEKYAANVLGPWGYNTPTGNVYYTTELQINGLVCAGKTIFALTQTQREEIDSTRSLITRLRSHATLVAALSPSTNSVVPSSAIEGQPSMPTKEPEATSSDVALPPSVEVGLGQSKNGSWLSSIAHSPSAMIASVASAYHSFLSVFQL